MEDDPQYHINMMQNLIESTSDGPGQDRYAEIQVKPDRD